MDELDKKINRALSKKIEEPYTYERTLKKALYQNKHSSIKSYIKNGEGNLSFTSLFSISVNQFKKLFLTFFVISS